MPELPDVDAFRKVLASCAQGATIRRVDVRDTGVLHGVSARRLRRDLEGRVFAAPRRHGKWLLAPVEPTDAREGAGRAERERGGGGAPAVLLHFGMTGRLVCCGVADEAHRHDRIVFTVDSGGGGVHDERQLRYRDQRKLKGLWLVDGRGVDRMLRDQGPDAATVGRAEFDDLLAGRRGRVKTALTDQSVLAGLGNLLADEILWRARLGPGVRADRLSGDERERLYTQMRRTVDSSVRAGRVPDRASWLTGHRDDDHGTCPRCGGTLRRDRVSGRATVWCPHCQRHDDGA